MICNYFPEPTWLIFVPDIPQLLYYSHIPTIIIALATGLFVFMNGRKVLLNRLLFIITLSFSFWALFNLIAWTNTQSDFILFIWSFFAILTAFVSIFSIYFTYVFLKQKDLPIISKGILLLLLIPLILFATTDLNLSGFNITSCGAYDFEGVWYSGYVGLLGIISVFSIFFMIVQEYRRAIGNRRKEIVFFGLGIELFLLLFVFVTLIGSYLQTAGITKDARLEMYGLFGMDIFAIVLAYLIVKFKTFNTKLIATQALVVGLIVLIGSLVFFEMSPVGNIIVAISVALACVGGFFLVRSVQKEIRQRKELEQLTIQLEAANERLKELDKAKSEFVSIASHQLRSPLTAIRGYASMLVEGSFGQLPQKAQEVAKRIEDSTKLMAMSIEDYLNVSRIESGNMKYNLSDFNLLELTSKICDDLRPEALKQNLILLFRSDISTGAMVNADVGKVHQIIHNLVNNSIKYTQKGSISVFMREDLKAKRIYIDISDTGIGMSQKTIDSLFQKFSRADNANSVNTSGTGLGLYVAVKMAEAMGGSISAHSEGDGKGSTFTFELPLAG